MVTSASELVKLSNEPIGLSVSGLSLGCCAGAEGDWVFGLDADSIIHIAVTAIITAAAIIRIMPLLLICLNSDISKYLNISVSFREL